MVGRHDLNQPPDKMKESFEPLVLSRGWASLGAHCVEL